MNILVEIIGLTIVMQLCKYIPAKLVLARSDMPASPADGSSGTDLFEFDSFKNNFD